MDIDTPSVSHPDAAGRWNTLSGGAPRIIAHRGASGYRPEHTLDAYALAIAQGADALEPDLVMSRDGVLFARHDLGLAQSTDIAQRAEFASRARVVGGRRNWWIGDFDAAEIDLLRAIQPDSLRDKQHDGHHIVPRFAHVLDLAQAASRQRGAPVIVDAEIKHPEFFLARGFDVVDAVARELAARGLTGPLAPVWLECFDHVVLYALHLRCGNACFALFDAKPDAQRLRDLSGWVRGIAPSKYLLWDAAGKDTGLVEAAHALGLEVHAWTFRQDRPSAPFASPRVEFDAAFALGVDALFCDFPDVAVAARAAFNG